nr:luciferin 4-monooxygenase-like [Onthophagus taurus]
MIAIAPSELEGILIQHPSVKLAAVIGKPTDEGDLATAVIVKKIDNVTAEELEALVAAKVDERKKLRGGVLFIDENEIPMTPTGKDICCHEAIIAQKQHRQRVTAKLDIVKDND